MKSARTREQVQYSVLFEVLEPRVLMHGGVEHVAAPAPERDPWHGTNDGPPVIEAGDSVQVIGPHHGDLGHNQTAGKTHYFAETGDAHHFVWQDKDLTTPDVMDLFYDYRSLNGYSNLITAAQKQVAVSAMQDWTEATGGKLNFIQSTTAALADIINIGTGDLRALSSSYQSKAGGILGLGGGTYTHNDLHTITRGIVWMDKAETWDTTIGNGNVSGTFDYFTVVAQEIGHALGLGHTDDISGRDIMDGSYSGETAVFSGNDNTHVQSIYGFLTGDGTITPPPPPPPAPIAGVTVSPTTGLVTTEAGGTATFSVVLNSQPSANVTIALTSSDTTEGTVNLGSLTFTPATWNVSQAVTITGKDDTTKDGNINYTILLAPASSTDSGYNGMNPTDVTASNKDNEKSGKPSGSGSNSGTSVPTGQGHGYGSDKVVGKGKKGDVFAGATTQNTKRLLKFLRSHGLDVSNIFLMK